MSKEANLIFNVSMFLYGNLDKMWKYFVCLLGVSKEIIIIEYIIPKSTFVEIVESAG